MDSFNCCYLCGIMRASIQATVRNLSNSGLCTDNVLKSDIFLVIFDSLKSVTQDVATQISELCPHACQITEDIQGAIDRAICRQIVYSRTLVTQSQPRLVRLERRAENFDEQNNS